MKINWKNAILAGIIGTVLFDLVGFMLSKSWDIPTLLASKLGGGLWLGGLAHYSNGIAIAIIYAALAPSLFGPKWFRAVSFITAQTVLGVWFFMLPLLGAGIAGVAMDPSMPVVTLARHILYIIPAIFLIKTASEAQVGSCNLGHANTQTA